MNGLLIISGAFGVFKRDLLLAVGGFSKETMGEDMELTMRMHEQLRAQRPELRDRVQPRRELVDRGAGRDWGR